MLILVAVLSVVADLVSLAPLIGGFAKLFLLGYICALYFEVIQTSATGGREVPEFPSISNLLEDIIWPALQTFIVLIFSFTPLLVYLFLMPQEGGSPGVFYACLGFGIFYAPMAMLAVVVLGRITALSPHIVLPSIFRAGWLYWASVFLLLFMTMTEGYIGGFLAPVSFLGYPIMILISTYTLLTNGRLLGILCREREEELNWL